LDQALPSLLVLVGLEIQVMDHRAVVLFLVLLPPLAVVMVVDIMILARQGMAVQVAVVEPMALLERERLVKALPEVLPHQGRMLAVVVVGLEV
jgi:hypothetical protein